MTISIPVPATWADGDRFYAETLNSRLYDPLHFLLFRRPMMRLYATSALTLPSGSFMIVAWQNEEIDTDNMFDSAQPTRITCKTAGIYKGWYGSSWYTSNTTNTGNGRRILIIRKNNTVSTVHRADFPPKGANSEEQVVKGIPFMVSMSVGDYIEMWQYQDNAAAGAMATSVVLPYAQPEMYLRWYAPL